MPSFSGLRLERAKASRQFRDGKFHNTVAVAPGLKKGESMLPVVGEFLFGGAKRRPSAPLPVESPLEVWQRPTSTGLRMSWLGHSTVLVEVDGHRFLTDPVFGGRVSPVSWAGGSKRFHPTPASIAQLPKLDAVLLSHDHYDHLCRESIETLAKLGVPVVTSLGVGARLERMGVRTIHELDWWEDVRLGGLKFTSTPSQHFSGRTLTDRNDTLWSSWVIESEKRRIFFSGDTGLTEEFATVRERFGAFDVVMLEIGAWNEMWGDIHLGPKGALDAFDLLGGGTLLPVHWGTFDLGLHPWDAPAEELLALAGDRRILTPVLGRPFEPEQVEGPTPWWRTALSSSAEIPRAPVVEPAR